MILAALRLEHDTRSYVPYRLNFTLQGLPETTNAARHSNGHWSARHKKDKSWKQQVWLEAQQKGRPKKPLHKATVTLIRYSASEPDFEGLVSSFKTILDGLTEAGVIANDSMSVIGQPIYYWRKAKLKEGKIEVFVEDIQENGDA